MLNFKKYLTLGLLTLAPFGAFAQSQNVTLGIPDGSYKGKFRGQQSGRVHFIVNPMNGCDGCFVATIFKRQNPIFGSIERQVKAYKALPLNSAYSKTGRASTSEYSLTPIDVDTDGELTTVNDNPSMRLTITSDVGTEDVHFSLSAAGSDNHDPFASAMEFKGKESPFDTNEGESGVLRNGWSCKTVGTIGMFNTSQEDQVTRFATITSFGTRRDASGTFQVEEKAPGVFTYTSIGLYSWGEELATMPKKLIIFIEKGSKERALLINPSNTTDIGELRINKN